MKKLFLQKKNIDLMRIAYLFISLIMLLVVVIIAVNISDYGKKYDAIHKKNVETAIYDALITCYSLEGAYPDSIDHLADKYGVILDKKKYIVRYEIIASNIFPDFEIIEYPKKQIGEKAFIYEEEGDLK